MPWTGASFKSRHNQSLTMLQAKSAARQANAILKKTGDDGLAIRTANAAIKRKKGKKSAKG
jgi:hypothetical protein